MNRLILGITLATLLTGCAGMPSAERQGRVVQPITCTDKVDCDAKWSRAESYIANHSYWKIKVATDTLIQTEGPMDTMELAYTSSKVINRDGSGEISATISCGNMFGCSIAPIDALEAFRAYVN